MDKQEPILIGITEAVKYTGIGRNRLLELAKVKGFPALIFPHKILIDKEALPDWIRRNYGTYKR